MSLFLLLGILLLNQFSKFQILVNRLCFFYLDDGKKEKDTAFSILISLCVFDVSILEDYEYYIVLNISISFNDTIAIRTDTIGDSQLMCYSVFQLLPAMMSKDGGTCCMIESPLRMY